jgi:hypothetical protein
MSIQLSDRRPLGALKDYSALRKGLGLMFRQHRSFRAGPFPEDQTPGGRSYPVSTGEESKPMRNFAVSQAEQIPALVCELRSAPR